MPLAQIICQLTQYSTSSMLRRINFNLNILFQIEVLKDRRFSQSLI